MMRIVVVRSHLERRGQCLVQAGMAGVRNPTPAPPFPERTGDFVLREGWSVGRLRGWAVWRRMVTRGVVFGPGLCCGGIDGEPAVETAARGPGAGMSPYGDIERGRGGVR